MSLLLDPPRYCLCIPLQSKYKMKSVSIEIMSTYTYKKKKKNVWNRNTSIINWQIYIYCVGTQVFENYTWYLFIYLHNFFTFVLIIEWFTIVLNFHLTRYSHPRHNHPAIDFVIINRHPYLFRLYYITLTFYIRIHYNLSHFYHYHNLQSL